MGRGGDGEIGRGGEGERGRGSVCPPIPPSPHLIFEVEDTGIGIVPEHLEAIFLPFRQVKSPHALTEGTGLGLAISQKLVTIMGGNLQVVSTPGKGSTFRFESQVPEVQNFAPKERSYGRKIIGYQGERRTAFVVDDDANNRAVLVGMLLPLGFRVLEAQNGQECVEQTLKYHPDIILLDLRMPVLDGFGAVKAIREYETQHPKHETPAIIIAVSASVFESTRKRAIDIGFTDFLIKPFQVDDLLNLFHTHLHLEWLYQEPEPERKQELPDIQRHLARFPLFSEDVERLRHLASLGIVKQLLAALDAIEQRDNRYAPVVGILRRLAKRYQFNQILDALTAKEQPYA